MADTASIAEALELVRDGRGFEAHELLEDLWRAADDDERDLYQGLVHVAVATYQDARGNAVGRTRQLEKALRRLGPYAPAYEGIAIEPLLAWCRAALAAADDLTKTVHYGVVAEEVVDVVQGEPVELIETLAVQMRQARGKRRPGGGQKKRLDGPVFAGLEDFDLGFAVADQPECDRLDTAGAAAAG